VQLFKEILAAVRVALQLIGAGSIVAGVGWLLKKRQRKLENRILKFFEEEEDEWHSAENVHAEVCLRTALKGVPAFVAFPTMGMHGWQMLKLRIKSVPYQLRDFFQKLLLLPSSHRIDSALRAMWERGLLVKASFNPKYYRLKHG
jgi:hypothetical protein